MGGGTIRGFRTIVTRDFADAAWLLTGNAAWTSLFAPKR